MSTKLEVRLSEETGLAYTCVPGHAMWDLVEYLASQRTLVIYGYSVEGFTVTFRRLGKAAAQRLLDAWAAAQVLEPSTVAAGREFSARRAHDPCYLPG